MHRRVDGPAQEHVAPRILVLVVVDLARETHITGGSRLIQTSDN